MTCVPPHTSPPLSSHHRCLHTIRKHNIKVCSEYLLLLPVSIAVDCLSSLAVAMGATRAARLLGYVKTNGDRQHVSSLN